MSVTLLHNNHCEFTTQPINSKGYFVVKRKVLNLSFNDFSYTKINQTQIWYDKFK